MKKSRPVAVLSILLCMIFFFTSSASASAPSLLTRVVSPSSDVSPVAIGSVPVLETSNVQGSTSDVAVGSWRDIYGIWHSNSVRFWVVNRSGWNNTEYGVFNLGGKYDLFSGSLYLEEHSDSEAEVYVNFYLDNRWIGSTACASSSSGSVPFEVAVSGGQKLKIECVTYSSKFGYGLIDGRLKTTVPSQPAPGSGAKTITLTAQTQYEMNIFLSNFTEQLFSGYNSETTPVSQVIAFIHTYLKINASNLISYQDYNGVTYETFSLSTFNSQVNRFFGETYAESAVQNYIVTEYNQYRGYITRSMYRNGSFWFEAADGESMNRLAVVSSAVEQNGQIYVNYTGYALDLQKYFKTGITSDYYYLSSSAAGSRSDLTRLGGGTAVLVPYNINGRSTYRLLSYTWALG